MDLPTCPEDVDVPGYEANRPEVYVDCADDEYDAAYDYAAYDQDEYSHNPTTSQNDEQEDDNEAVREAMLYLKNAVEYFEKSGFPNLEAASTVVRPQNMPVDR